MIKTRRNIRKKSFKSKKRLNQRLKKTSKKRLKRTSKRGGCYREYTADEAYPEVTINDIPEATLQLPDFDSKKDLSTRNEPKKQMIYFSSNYPDKTYADFLSICILRI